MFAALELAAKISCIILLVFQGAILDLYLVKEHDTRWASFVIADVTVICVWVVCLITAHRFFKFKQDEVDAGKDPEEYPDELPLAFAAWLVYAALLTPRIAILFGGSGASRLKEKDFFGPNTLKAGAACTPLIFILLVYAHHDSKPHTVRKYYIQSLTGSIAFDLFDSLDLLEFLFLDREEHKFPRALTTAVLVFACLNFFLPTLALFELKINSFTGQVSSLSSKVLYSCAFVFLVNVPNLIIRSVLWHKYNTDVSVLLMKNVICVVIGIVEIMEYFGKERPQPCPKCRKWYTPDFLERHRQKCKAKPLKVEGENLSDENEAL
ncbi:uncharacterized protein LOC135692585 [Rhopilema esculentum]|uniref:uncharacterized protein LOC135692585 n=1 Tax=Rhopilema esculentum TaxID=499914 RepID=UPI0031CDB57E|eukprot:gene2162-17752_t